MDNLQQYFKSHDNYIGESDEGFPEHDMERFESRWEAHRHNIKFRSNLKRRKKPLWKVVAFPFVASIALIIGVRMLMKPFIAEQPSDPQTIIATLPDTASSNEVYALYHEMIIKRVNELYNISTVVDDPDQVLMTVDIITRESAPLIDLLPEEMSESDKKEVLADYSQQMIDALDYLKNRLITINNL